MDTFLFDKIIFGPVKSRRLGISLGINLLPLDQKVCSFDCIYCECGWNDKQNTKHLMPKTSDIIQCLEKEFNRIHVENQIIDTITFAGNGEPSLHKDFAFIIQKTKELRDQFLPTVKIAVLSNSTNLGKVDVFQALQSIELPIMKMDTVIENTYRELNRPVNNQTIQSIIEGLKFFHGNFILQTMFLRGSKDLAHLDNTTMQELRELMDVIKELSPRRIMIYSLERCTPEDRLLKIDSDELYRIAAIMKEEGIFVEVYD